MNQICLPNNVCCIVLLQKYLALSLMVVIPELQRWTKIYFEGSICSSNNFTPFPTFILLALFLLHYSFSFYHTVILAPFNFFCLKLVNFLSFGNSMSNLTAILAIYIYSASPKGDTDEKGEIREPEGISAIFTISNLSNARTGFIYVCINLYLS